MRAANDAGRTGSFQTARAESAPALRVRPRPFHPAPEPEPPPPPAPDLVGWQSPARSVVPARGGVTGSQRRPETERRESRPAAPSSRLVTLRSAAEWCSWCRVVAFSGLVLVWHRLSVERYLRNAGRQRTTGATLAKIGDFLAVSAVQPTESSV